MNSIDWWSLALVPGVAALGICFDLARRVCRLEREMRRDESGPVLIRIPTMDRRRGC